MIYRGGENGRNIQRILYRNGPFKAHTGQRTGFKAISMQQFFISGSVAR